MALDTINGSGQQSLPIGLQCCAERVHAIMPGSDFRDVIAVYPLCIPDVDNRRDLRGSGASGVESAEFAWRSTALPADGLYRRLGTGLCVRDQRGLVG